MHVELRKAGEVVVVDLVGKLTAGLGDLLLRETLEQLLADRHKKILVNLSQVAFIDSAGVGELVAGLRACQREGSALKILNSSERVNSTLYLARLLPIFEVYQDEHDALQHFVSAAGPS